MRTRSRRVPVTCSGQVADSNLGASSGKPRGLRLTLPQGRPDRAEAGLGAAGWGRSTRVAVGRRSRRSRGGAGGRGCRCPRGAWGPRSISAGVSLGVPRLSRVCPCLCQSVGPSPPQPTLSVPPTSQARTPDPSVQEGRSESPLSLLALFPRSCGSSGHNPAQAADEPARTPADELVSPSIALFRSGQVSLLPLPTAFPYPRGSQGSPCGVRVRLAPPSASGGGFPSAALGPGSPLDLGRSFAARPRLFPGSPRRQLPVAGPRSAGLPELPASAVWTGTELARSLSLSF